MTYACFLRGINVGGNNKISMANLRTFFESLGMTEVKTYIQSGNIVFKSEESKDSLDRRLNEAIKTEYGLIDNVILRTPSELNGIIKALPFTSDEIAAADAASSSVSLYVALLRSSPDFEKQELLTKFINPTEKCVIIGSEAYLLFHESIRDSKLATKLTLLGVNMTVRNWNTLSKVCAMAQ